MTTVIATNDFHSEVVKGGPLLSALWSWKARGAVLIDAGDFFGGNAFHQFSGGAVERRLLAELYDAVVPGNHDLADLAKVTGPGRFPTVVCANLRPPADFGGDWVSGLLLREPGGVAVGVVGFIGEQAFHAATPDERRPFRFVPPTPELLRAERDRLRADGADVVVGVSHSGFLADVEFQQAHGLFDVLLSGHCHSGHYYWSAPGRGHVVKAPECATGYARVELTAGRTSAVSVEWCADADATGPALPAWLHQAEQEYRAWAGTVVGELAAPVPDRRAAAALIAETAARTHGTLFVINQGTIRTGLPSTIDRAALLNCAPFDSPLVACELPGTLPDLLARVEAIGEQAVWSGAAISTAFVTTGYLASRLAVPYQPLQPRCGIHSTISDIHGGTP